MSSAETPALEDVGAFASLRRLSFFGRSLWKSFNRVQENAIRGGQPGRSTQGQRIRTRQVASIDRGVSLNRALWVLAEEMRKLKS